MLFNILYGEIYGVKMYGFKQDSGRQLEETAMEHLYRQSEIYGFEKHGKNNIYDPTIPGCSVKKRICQSGIGAATHNSYVLPFSLPASRSIFY